MHKYLFILYTIIYTIADEFSQYYWQESFDGDSFASQSRFDACATTGLHIPEPVRAPVVAFIRFKMRLLGLAAVIKRALSKRKFIGIESKRGWQTISTNFPMMDTTDLVCMNF